jgi:hypothetical protein
MSTKESERRKERRTRKNKKRKRRRDHLNTISSRSRHPSESTQLSIIFLLSPMMKLLKVKSIWLTSGEEIHQNRLLNNLNLYPQRRALEIPVLSRLTLMRPVVTSMEDLQVIWKLQDKSQLTLAMLLYQKLEQLVVFGWLNQISPMHSKT